MTGTILVNYLNQSYEKTTKSKYDFPTFQLIMVKNRFKNITFPLEIAGVPSGKAKQKALELVELVGLKGRESAYPSELSGDKNKE